MNSIKSQHKENNSNWSYTLSFFFKENISLSYPNFHYCDNQKSLQSHKACCAVFFWFSLMHRKECEICGVCFFSWTIFSAVELIK